MYMYIQVLSMYLHDWNESNEKDKHCYVIAIDQYNWNYINKCPLPVAWISYFTSVGAIDLVGLRGGTERNVLKSIEHDCKDLLRSQSYR